MDTFEFLKSITSITDKINKSIYPFNTNEWLPKINTGLDFNQLIKSMSYNNYIHNDLLKLSTPPGWNYDFNKALINQLSNNNSININNTIFDKINSIGYWGDIARQSLISGNHIFNDNEVLISEVITNNIENVNETIAQIEKAPLEFFNNIFISIKTYMDNNPSVKYSAQFVAFIISIYITVIITNYLSSSSDDDKPQVNQVFNSYTIVENKYQDDPAFKINCKSASLKNHPRNDSKTVCNLLKNEKVKVLKDSLKWAFVIKENTVETGWIRKEFLNLSK